MAKVTDCDKGKATTVVRGENETLWNYKGYINVGPDPLLKEIAEVYYDGIVFRVNLY
jgi:hypothetical protein